jgi:hypothetical protein
VCEIKAPGKASDGDATQLFSYIHEVSALSSKKIIGMLINDGNISPKLRQAARGLKITIRAYGVKIATIEMN